jgi:hypothetical protein
MLAGQSDRAGSIPVEPIRDTMEYAGQRVVFQGNLGTARIKLQLDIGFGRKCLVFAKNRYNRKYNKMK